MKKWTKWITSPAATVLLFAAAAGLLLFSTIGGARAAFLAYSDTYVGHVEMYDIGVSLLEESEKDADGDAREVAYRYYIQDSQDEWEEVESKTWGKGVGDLLQNLVARDSSGNATEELVLGRAYKEKLSVANSGTINEYVRVTVYKYWTDPNGNKVFAASGEENQKGLTTPGLSPDLIDLHYINQDVWIRDEENSAETEERTVFYYSKVLESGEDTTETPLTDTLTIDKSIADKISKTTVKESEDGKHKTISTTYDYDGWQFCVEAHVDAVQEHNAADAIKSAWGRDVEIADDGTLSLK